MQRSAWASFADRDSREFDCRWPREKELQDRTNLAVRLRLQFEDLFLVRAVPSQARCLRSSQCQLGSGSSSLGSFPFLASANNSIVQLGLRGFQLLTPSFSLL